MNISSDLSARREQESDDQLVSEAQSGDQQAFAELCLRYRGMLMSRIYRIVRQPEDAEDVLQETLLSAYQHLDSFRGACRFSTWMTKIGINRALMLLRKRKSQPETGPDVIMDDGQNLETREFRDSRLNPEQRFVMFKTLQGLSQAIDKLPPHFRGMMDLYYRRDLLLKDAAEALGISEQAAKSRLMRARNLLRHSFNNHGMGRQRRPTKLEHALSRQSQPIVSEGGKSQNCPRSDGEDQMAAISRAEVGCRNTS